LWICLTISPLLAFFTTKLVLKISSYQKAHKLPTARLLIAPFSLVARPRQQARAGKITTNIKAHKHSTARLMIALSSLVARPRQQARAGKITTNIKAHKHSTARLMIAP